jgi:hypothetical protein
MVRCIPLKQDLVSSRLQAFQPPAAADIKKSAPDPQRVLILVVGQHSRSAELEGVLSPAPDQQYPAVECVVGLDVLKRVCIPLSEVGAASAHAA